EELSFFLQKSERLSIGSCFIRRHALLYYAHDFGFEREPLVGIAVLNHAVRLRMEHYALAFEIDAITSGALDCHKRIPQDVFVCALFEALRSIHCDLRSAQDASRQPVSCCGTPLNACSAS